MASQDAKEKAGSTETCSLPQFLEARGWVERFLEKVFPAFVYLQTTLGKRMLEHPGANGVLTPDGSPRPRKKEYRDLIWNEQGGNIPKQNREIVALPTAPGGGQDVSHYNFHIISLYLRNLERALLGSYLREGPGRRMHVSGYQEDGPPKFLDRVTPFAALLEEEQVDTGMGGRAGGPRKGRNPYHPPYEGEPRPVSVEQLNKALDAIMEACDDSSFPSNHFVLAGYSLIFSELRTKVESVAGPQTTPIYTGHPAPFVRPQILFPRMMPDNALYIVSPQKVCIHAKPFCEITTRDSDGKILEIRSSIAHSLLHHEEAERQGQSKAAFSDLQGHRISDLSLRLKEHHYAILAVTP